MKIAHDPTGGIWYLGFWLPFHQAARELRNYNDLEVVYEVLLHRRGIEATTSWE